MPKNQPTDRILNDTLRHTEETARRMSAAVPEYYRKVKRVVRRGTTTLRFMAPDIQADTELVDGREN